MGNSSASPRSQQRLRVFDAYRGRGRRTNALWLVYSVKLDQDLILSSDRRLVHWLAFLEADPLVKSFELSTAERGSALDAPVTVRLANELLETHIVVAGSATPNEIAALHGRHGQYEGAKIFTDLELRPQVSVAMRWHKALAFAAAIRDRECTPLRLALIPFIRSLGSGTLGQILKELHTFEESALVGVLVRLAIEGNVSIDLSRSGVSYATFWTWRERGDYVVA